MASDDQKKAPVPQVADNIVTQLAEQDKTPWYQKRNLRFLYFVFFPTCLGVEMTSGCVTLRRLPVKFEY